MTRKLLLGAGFVLVGLGLLWPWLRKAGLGRLPGDFVFERGGFRLYFPLATSILLSLLLSVILWMLRK